ncbi:hypothetical protein EVAR_36808_1 [Eumeta japonica]|uniref:Uncharacterized protein n=1 Tax=Eumeta variegata TaxID=151549 RepID=A0A4C1WYU4_EUMVA|nr:hypothetical protein EVAR_36808_1 [Eumeta japonica]
MRSLSSTCGVSQKNKCRNSDVRERCGLNKGVVTRVERVPMASFQLHHQTLDNILRQCTRHGGSNELKLDGVASFYHEVPMTTSQLHHQITSMSS